ncbi:MAG: DUF3419 family protein [Bacteriovoracaceae bacterium]
MAHQYFEDFNYSLANEDTWVELKSAPENCDSIFAVCGSGSRSVPLLALNAKELHVTDLSINQLRLFQLRLAAIKSLDYEEYLFFLGYQKKWKDQDPLKTRLEFFNRMSLNSEEKFYWEERKVLWMPNGVIYLGKWEKHFMMLGRLFQKITFSNLDPIFAAKSLEEQKPLVKKYWARNAFKFYTQIVLNAYVSNKLLYKGFYAGSDELRTSSLTPAELIFQEFNHVFDHTWARSNYFLQLIFLNEVRYPEAFPAEATKEIFNKVKMSQTKVIYHQKNLLQLAKEQAHDFYSLSDTFSYLTDTEAQEFFRDLPILKSGSKVFIRSFMRNPRVKFDGPWKTLEQEIEWAKKTDSTRMYEFKILQKL